MNPDRRAEIGPNRNPDINPVARVALAGFLAAGSLTYLPPLLEKLASGLPSTPVGEAFNPNCRAGLGMTVDNEAFSKGARVIVVEDSNGRRIADGKLRIGQEVLVTFEGPSDTVKNGKDARQVVYFATDANGRRVSPGINTAITCGKFEHVSSIVEEGIQKRETPTPSRTATQGSTLSPSAAENQVATLKDEVQKLQKLVDQAKRAEEDKKLTETAEARGEVKGRAAAVAEEQEKTRVETLIRQAKDQGRADYIAAATAVVSSTAGAAGKGAGGSFEIPQIPWIPVAGVLGILALGWAELKSKKVQRTTVNTFRFPDRAFRHFILKQAHVQLWP
ncbi:hypothetical protein HYS96_04570 [Candidatus Daviesbacteria bacterium]|nr:hypothetical protein [Candidatus Daviesbacteria bacterium]